MLVGTTLATIADGNPQRWLDMASLTALVFAVMSVFFYVIKFSTFIIFISDTILLGFKAGAAFVIGLTQLPKIFGVKGGGQSFFERVYTLFQQVPDTNIYVFVFGILCVLAIIFGEKLFPHKPVTIIVVVVATLIMSFTPLIEAGFKTVGVIPSGLPTIGFPKITLNDLYVAGPLALACFLLAYIESISAARTLAHKHGYTVDARQELLALGAANFAVSLGGGYPVSGGLSQSAVNDGAGAKTPISLMFTSVLIALCLIFLTGLLKNLPLVVLAAIVLVAIKGLVDFKAFRRLFKVNSFDFIVACIAFISVVVFGILEGIIIAAVASLAMMIKAVSNPHVAFLGRIPGTSRFSDFKRNHTNEMIPGVLIFRVESALWYFNITNVHNTVWKKVLESDSSLQLVVFDLSTSAFIDSEAARYIKKLYLDLKELGITLKIVEAHSEVRDILRLEGIEHIMGHISRRDSVNDAITGFIEEHKFHRHII
jgi:high affinity sulfate transporter 1